MKQWVLRLMVACMLGGGMVACDDDDDPVTNAADDGEGGSSTAVDEDADASDEGSGKEGDGSEDAADDVAEAGDRDDDVDEQADATAVIEDMDGAAGMVADEEPAAMDLADCEPSAEEFESTISGLLQSRCGVCHGEEPKYGAPYTLLDYDGLLQDDQMGRRKVLRLLARLSDGTMPPAGNVRPTVSEFDTITSWASCGAASPPYPSNLMASREILQAPDEIPAGTMEVPLTADEFAVPAERPEVYQNFIFSNVVDHEVFVRRFEAHIDEAAVVHHITLHYGDTDRYLYAWAPGTGAVEFPDGGLRIGPDDAFRVEIHYNNGRGLTGVKDSSGVVLRVSEPEGTEYAMLDPTTFDISVPPRMESSAQVTCDVGSDFQIFAGLPHMHEVGTSYLHEIERASGEKETLIELSGWSFDQQYFYEMGVDVQVGDKMTITCNYRNDTDQPIRGGLGTSDEMCYDFIYVTPPDAALNCPQTMPTSGLDLITLP